MHPVLFVLAGQPVYTYGTLLALAMCGVLLLLTYLAVRERVSIGHVLFAYLGAAVLGFMGARLAYAVANIDETGSIAAAFDMRRGGFVGYGGLVGYLAGAWLFLRRGPVRVLVALDLAAPCAAAWLAVVRVGCYAFGCDFGVPLPAGAPAWLARLGTFPHWSPGTVASGEGAPAWAQHVREGLIPISAPTSLPVHPTQLYDVLLGAALFWAAFALRPFQRFRGQIFLSFVMLYGAWRFAFDVLRDDSDRIGPTFAEHRIIPMGLALFGLAYARRVAPIVENLAARRVTQLLAFVPALAALAALWPRSFGETVAMELTVSQWTGLLTGLAASYAFAVLHRRAAADPEGAMATGPVVPAPARR
jgi:phosphatidylglycerol:prolipoprotein diacylglycerol transferase